MKFRLKIQLTIALLALLAMASCSNQSSRQQQGYMDADGYNDADSVVSAIGDERDYPRLLAVTDSFVRAGELTPVRAIFYKTIAYNLTGQQRKALRLYYDLSKIDVGTLKTQADIESYLYSYKDYVKVLCDMRRYDRALREAYAADRKLKKAGYDSFVSHQDIAQTIGECLLYLGQADEAAQNFEKSLQSIRVRLNTYQDPLDYRECQKTMNAIARAYMRTNRYEEATPWVERQDSLFSMADIHPQRDSVFVDEMKAEINYSKALLAHALGRHAEAERAFAAYQSTKTAQTLGSIIQSNEYLMLSHRYEEAVRNYWKLDQFLKESGYKADLEVIGRYMIPKYRANILAGHRDSALHVANVVAEYYDTALVRQKTIDADLISTIYDTEGKERKIAEQRAKLSQQRLISVAAVMVTIFVFFHIYAMQRKRAYRRLDQKNRELMLANERAEESSRMKTKFIQQISHEVRTPLNVLSGFSQVLATPDIELDSNDLQDISKKIVENSDRITKLVDKMLDLSIINSNADIDCQDVISPAVIAQEAVAKSGIQRAAHLDFHMELSPEVQDMLVRTHKKAAVKALTLLLDNAIKFTHPLAFKGHHGETRKARAVLSVTASQEQVVFTIEDTGISIPTEQAENIFTEFVQLDEYSDGTGIGLSIARSLTRHMKGDILLDTSYTEGARFVMWLPLQI